MIKSTDPMDNFDWHEAVGCLLFAEKETGRVKYILVSVTGSEMTEVKNFRGELLALLLTQQQAKDHCIYLETVGQAKVSH